MELYGLDKHYMIYTVLDCYQSLIWHTQYCGTGDFELYLKVSSELLNELPKYITRSDTESGMILEKVQIITDAEAGDHLILTGRSFESILHRRVIMKQTILTGNVEEAIRQLIQENIIGPDIEARKIHNFRLGERKGFTETFTKQFTGDNLGEAIEEICRTYHYGYHITLQEGCFVFDLYKGEDRSYRQDENPFIVFSQDFENLLSSNYTMDTMNYKNAAIIGGEGEGLRRKTGFYGLDVEGLERREVYVDSRNCSSNNDEIGEMEYKKMLEEEGRQALCDLQTVTDFDGEVDYSRSYQYGVDYQMGDIVQAINNYGIQFPARITEIIESDSAEGLQKIPTLCYEE